MPLAIGISKLAMCIPGMAIRRTAYLPPRGGSHRLTKPYHPWTNGQAERMNRTVKDATAEVFHDETTKGLRDHILAFVSAYNFAKHLKALRWRTPFHPICDAYKADPGPFKINPHHLIPGPDT